MPNRAKNPGTGEEYFIDTKDSREIDFWMTTLGLSAKTLVRAVDLVGPDAREVKKWMKKNNPKKKPPLYRRVYAFLANSLKPKHSHEVTNH